MGMLKKLALVSAMSAVSMGVNADLSLLEDSVLGDVTGQAGVTIEMEANVSIAQIAYKDEGSILINGIQIGGLTTLDASQDAFLQNSVSALTGIPAVAITQDAGSLAAMMVYLGQGNAFVTDIDTTINNMGGTAGVLPAPIVQAYVTGAMEAKKAEELSGATSGAAYDATLAAVQGGGQVAAAVAADLDHYVSVVGTSRLNLSAYGAGDFEVAGTREAIKNIKQTIDVNADGDLVIHVGSTIDTPILLGLQIDNVQLQSADKSATNSLLQNIALKAVIGPQDITIHNGTGTHTDGSALAGISIDMEAYFAVADLDLDVTLGSGSIGVRDVTISDGGGFAKISQTIYAQDDAGATRSAGLVIESGEMNMDIGIGGVLLGGTSIGSLAISGLNMAGSKTVVYGHN